jgi:hypothetical protein
VPPIVLDEQIAQRFGAAQQRPSIFTFAIGQRIRRGRAEIDFAVFDEIFSGRTIAVPATVLEFYPLAERRI